MAKEVKKCIIVSGAPDDDLDFIKSCIDNDEYIIAADSGYKKLEAISIKPDIIIGDFDSSELPTAYDNVIKLQVEKAYTDTFTAVRYAVENGYNDILLLGAIGCRVDHTYSNILCLDYCRKYGANCMIANPKNRLCLITDTKRVYKDYQYFSLFAYLEDCEGVKIKGAYYTAGFYNLESLDIKVGDQFAQSNFVSDDYAEISLESGTLLLIESND